MGASTSQLEEPSSPPRSSCESKKLPPSSCCIPASTSSVSTSPWSKKSKHEGRLPAIWSFFHHPVMTVVFPLAGSSSLLFINSHAIPLLCTAMSRCFLHSVGAGTRLEGIGRAKVIEELLSSSKWFTAWLSQHGDMLESAGPTIVIERSKD
ncbi:unnamed protein product [Victoria cruziana]